MIALLLPLLSLWIAIALAVIDGFALPLARMKADHLTADCIQQASLREDGAIPPHSDAAKACARSLAPTLSFALPDASSSGRPLADAKPGYSITSAATTRCAIPIALCVLPHAPGEPLAAGSYRAIRYEYHQCELNAQRAYLIESLPNQSSAGSSNPIALTGTGQAFALGLVPVLDCDQQGPLAIDLRDWHCLDQQADTLRWWGAASKLGSPCLLSAQQIAAGIEQARPMLGRSLKLRQS